MEFAIEITETLQHHARVQARSVGEAISIARRAYENCEIVLDCHDLTDVEFKAVEEDI